MRLENFPPPPSPPRPVPIYSLMVRPLGYLGDLGVNLITDYRVLLYRIHFYTWLGTRGLEGV